MELNKIYCENCLDTMARMPDGFIDLTVTSPPYDNLRDYNGYEFDFESIAKELYRVTKPGGVVVWVVGDATINGSETLTSFKQAIYFKEVCGFNLYDTMIYSKPPHIPTEGRYYNSFEYMFIFCKGIKPSSLNLIIDRINRIAGSKKHKEKVIGKNSKYDGRGGVNGIRIIKKKGVRSNIWEYAIGSGSTSDKIAFNHRAIFPEKLARDHIYSWSNENDIVYDPFCGSGTTPKMAHLQKRRWIGSEISQEYVDLANKRLEPYLRQLTMF